MVYSFDKKAVVLFFPKGWGNGVVDWISGVHSPKNTITVKNTLNPTDKGSLALDVNVPMLADRVREVLAERRKSK